MNPMQGPRLRDQKFSLWALHALPANGGKLLLRLTKSLPLFMISEWSNRAL